MTKIIYTTDWHLVSKSPQYRKDNIILKQFYKVKKILDFALTNNVNMIIHGGDVFDVPSPSLLILNHLAKGLATFKKRGGCPIYFVYGQHDLIGYDPDSLKRTGVGTLLNAGLFKLLTNLKVDNKEFVGLPVSFSFYNTKYSFNNNCVVIHNIVTEEPLPYDCKLISELDRDSVNTIFLLGDLHAQFLVKTEKGNVFINPGPLVRTSVSERIIKPSFVLLSLDGEKVNIEIIPVSEEMDVFDTERFLKDKEDTLSFEEFVKKVQNITIMKNFDLENAIRKYGSQNNIKEEVINECLRRINL